MNRSTGSVMRTGRPVRNRFDVWLSVVDKWTLKIDATHDLTAVTRGWVCLLLSADSHLVAGILRPVGRGLSESVGGGHYRHSEINICSLLVICFLRIMWLFTGDLSLLTGYCVQIRMNRSTGSVKRTGRPVQNEFDVWLIAEDKSPIVTLAFQDMVTVTQGWFWD